jgi:hypothetical protein
VSRCRRATRDSILSFEKRSAENDDTGQYFCGRILTSTGRSVHEFTLYRTRPRALLTCPGRIRPTPPTAPRALALSLSLSLSHSLSSYLCLVRGASVLWEPNRTACVEQDRVIDGESGRAGDKERERERGRRVGLKGAMATYLFKWTQAKVPLAFFCFLFFFFNSFHSPLDHEIVLFYRKLGNRLKLCVNIKNKIMNL